MHVSESGFRLDKRIAILFFLPIALVILAYRASAQQSRITQLVDNRQRATLTGHLHPRALRATDQGRVSPGMEMPYVTVNLSQTPAQRADLEALVKDQVTPGSANYHKWLTPEQYADRFGLTQADFDKVSSWLQGQGLRVVGSARARNWIAVNGTAAQIETAFGTEIHNYLSSTGETHFANSGEPSIPAALAGVVGNIRGLSNYRPKPMARPMAKPHETSGSGNHYLAPDDIATIYDITPLYNAGITGAGQKIAVAGQTQINLSDITTFRGNYNLPANNPTLMLVAGSRNPGISQSDLPEADLDLEWSGAVARQASIIYVYSQDALTSVQYAIDQNLAPVVSVSYGLCEAETPASDLSAYETWALQGNSQGITWLAASGDNGAADCGDTSNPGLSVDSPGSSPHVVSVGGTEFMENSGNYWAGSNNANSASALSYIPEMAWNDSAQDGSPAATGGGASIFFPKPSWQVGIGVPGDTARHVPDIALNASADHDGYLVESGGSLQVYGGTSVPTPAFAGLTALLNQYLGTSGVGNLNASLYSLAQTNPAIFHDVTAGNNIVTASCGRRNPTCSNRPVGYNAGTGYDQATGLGSVDAYAFVTGFNGATGTLPTTSAEFTLLSNVSSISSSEVLYLIATITDSNSSTPSGTVTFQANGTTIGTAQLVGSAGTARATLAITGAQLTSGSESITATYSGSSSTALNVSVTGTSTGATPSITGISNGASFQQTFSPGGIISIFGSQLALSTSTASAVPLPITASGVTVLVNGAPAPLYYSSATQINAQIPYETGLGAATVTVNNNGRVTSQSINVAATGPGIFIESSNLLNPTTSASRGQEIALYITGAGAISPALATGYAPTTTLVSQLPRPVQTPTVTVGNVNATVDFAGIPTSLVGVMQINFTVPTGVATGTQPVVVSIGGVQSATALLNVTN